MGRELNPGSGTEDRPPAETLACRVHGPASAPALVYLPGIHGDWTLVGGFRAALAGRVRFVEFRYPRTLDWSLGRHADEVEAGLIAAGVESGWVVGESFGSQVAWPLCSGGRRFRAEGLILAGGFGRHPAPWLTWGARPLMAGIPAAWLKAFLGAYRGVARWRFRSAPDAMRDIDEFVERRTEPDRAAALHRMDLLMANDPAELARRLAIPVYYLTGLWDPVVPWPGVVRWLRRNCPAFRGWEVVRAADHNVLGSGSRSAAARVLAWMEVEAGAVAVRDGGGSVAKAKFG